VFAAKYQLKRVTIAILNCASFPHNRKVKSFKQTVTKCFAESKLTTRVRMLPFGIDTTPQSFCHSFIALSMIRCSKSAQKSAVQMCKISAGVMETTQLVLSQFKNSLSQSMENWIRYVCAKNISECCVLVKLYDINCSGPVFLDTLYCLHADLKGCL